MTTTVDIAIVGAGPYGLSLASHLSALGLQYRIFGQPMESWRAHMPAGMRLKSVGFATNISDPSGELTLGRYCVERGLPYDDDAMPIALECFHAYGLAFQKRFVPDVEEREVTAIERTGQGFRIEFGDGHRLAARRVVLAVGLHAFRHLPAEFVGLPRDLVSHAAEHGGLERFSGREVCVIGAGASGVELATLLHEQGAQVRLVTRARAIRFQPPPLSRSLVRRWLRPLSGIGHGWHSLAIAEAPQLVRLLPHRLRAGFVAHYMRPAPAWFVKERFLGRVEHLAGYRLRAARPCGNELELHLEHLDGGRITLRCEHVIAATGYRLEPRSLPILGEDLRGDLGEAAQRLSANFESAVPGLYVLGPLAAQSFGPAVRFVLGAGFSARCLSRHLSRIQSRAALATPAPLLAG